MTEDRDVDVVIVGAGFAGMYMLHQARELGLSAQVHRGRATTWAAPGTGTATRAPAATSRAWSTPTSSPTSCSRSGTGRERYATQPEILRYAKHVADRFDLRRDIQFDTRVAAATFDDDRATVDRPHRPRRRADRPVRRHGDRLPVVDQPPGHPRARLVRGPSYHTGRWPHEGVDFTGSAGRRDRHRLVGHPVDPDHRRAGGRAARVPAHADLLGAGPQPAARPRGAGADQGRLRRVPRRQPPHAHRLRRPPADAPSGRPSRSPRRSGGPSTRPAGPTAASRSSARSTTC